MTGVRPHVDAGDEEPWLDAVDPAAGGEQRREARRPVDGVGDDVVDRLRERDAGDLRRMVELDPPDRGARAARAARRRDDDGLVPQPPHHLRERMDAGRLDTVVVRDDHDRHSPTASTT